MLNKHKQTPEDVKLDSVSKFNTDEEEAYI